MCKNILCKSCRSKIGETINSELSFTEMKAISKIETASNGIYCKCRSCNSWNLFIKLDNYYIQKIDHQRKSKEVLQNFVK